MLLGSRYYRIVPYVQKFLQYTHFMQKDKNSFKHYYSILSVLTVTQTKKVAYYSKGHENGKTKIV